MIESINVCNDASYNDPQTFDALKAINFIYGANGSGKTTISRIIADPSTFPRASIQWKNGRAIEPLVYNSDFVSRTFIPQMKGIFTLGEESADILSQIDTAKTQVADYRTGISNLQTALGLDDTSPHCTGCAYRS